MSGESRRGRRAFALVVALSTAGTALLLLAEAPVLAIVAFVALSHLVDRVVRRSDLGIGTARQALAIRRALRRGQIVMHYQPKVSLATGELVAAEGLARWNHPRRGLLAPAEWIAATEVRGVEWHFLRHTLESALREAQAWEREHGVKVLVSVNVTPRCFDDRRFVTEVRNALDRAGVDHARLQLELTEAAFELSPAALTAAERLSELGVSLALDDFGVGHSSMSRLARLPMDELKIDRQFVSGRTERSERHAAVVRAAVGLGEELGLAVTAEGVETAEQAEALRSSGCHIGQGFYFSPPLPADELVRWARDREPLPERRITGDRRQGDRRQATSRSA